MEEFFEFLKFTAKVGLVETGRAVFWIGIGELLALLIGIVVFVSGWYATKPLFADSKIGKWCRWLLVLTWLLLIPPVLFSNGFFWGVNVAAENTIVSRQLIEHAFQESLSIPIDAALQQLENPSSKAENDTDGEMIAAELADASKVGDSSESSSLYSASRLLEQIDSMEAEALKQFRDRLADGMNFDSSIVPEWVLKWTTHQALGFVKGEDGPSVAEMIDSVREVIVHANENDDEKDDQVSARQLAWSLGATQGTPALRSYLSSTRRILLIFAAIEVVLILGISTFVLWLAMYLFDKSFNQRSDEQSEAPSPQT